ncbi:MAG: hypothetical protein VX899_21705 [Myxococcota bacterium]|nr:hypothetical protein [Myxococcota bacterium]
MILWLSLACASAPSDQALHAEALQAGAQAECAPISDPQLRGDCEAWRAHSLAKEDLKAAEAACKQISDPRWRGECWFLLSDAVRAVGTDAQRLCGQAAQYERECRGHAISREARRWLETPGNETQAQADLEQRWSALYKPEKARSEAQRMVVAQLLNREKPFTPQSFGDASEDIVRLTLAAHLRQHGCAEHGLSPSLDPALVVAARHEAACPARD